MPKTVKKYTEEYKSEAIKLALSSESISGVAKSLGMPEATLHGWVNRAKSVGQGSSPLFNGKEASVNVSELLEQNRQLRKQNARLEQEKAILKKAAAYFAKESV